MFGCTAAVLTIKGQKDFYSTLIYTDETSLCFTTSSLHFSRYLYLNGSDQLRPFILKAGESYSPQG